MASNDDQARYILISRRLVKRIVQEHESSKSSWRIDEVGTPDFIPVSATMSRQSIDWDNEFELARRATEAVRENTGGLDANNLGRLATRKRYLRLKMHFQSQLIPLWRWEGASDRHMAGFVGVERVPGIGHVFIGLVGSANNYLHYADRTPQSISGRTPSDARGLYDIIQATREVPESESPGQAFVDAEARTLASIEDRFSSAINSLFAAKVYEPSRLFEILIDIHHVSHNVQVFEATPDGHGTAPFDVAILGAPVWVRETAPEDYDLIGGTRRRYQIASAEGLPLGNWSMTYRQEIVEHPMGFIERQYNIAQSRAEGAELFVSREPFTLEGRWPVFESWLIDSLDVASDSSATRFLHQWPLAAADWESFVEWSLDHLGRMGPRVGLFFEPQRTWSWRRFKSCWKPQHITDPASPGWFIPWRSQNSILATPSASGFVIRPDRRVQHADVSGFLLVDENNAARGISGADPAYLDAVVAILRALVEWRQPAISPRQSRTVVIDGAGKVTSAYMR